MSAYTCPKCGVTTYRTFGGDLHACKVIEYRVDEAMCGPEFHGRVADVVAYLNDHGFPSVAVDDIKGGDGADEPDEDTWNAALNYAADQYLLADAMAKV